MYMPGDGKKKTAVVICRLTMWIGGGIYRFGYCFLVYPFAFKGKLIQYIGRITRSNQLPVIYDYRDRQIDYFEKLFKKRNRFYDELRKANQVTLDF